MVFICLKDFNKIFIFDCQIYIDNVVIYFCKYMISVNLWDSSEHSWLVKFSFLLISHLRLMAIPICMMQYHFLFQLCSFWCSRICSFQMFWGFQAFGEKSPPLKRPICNAMSSINVDLVYSKAILPEENLMAVIVYYPKYS